MFTVLMDRIRAGDQEAAGQLVKDYEAVVRREVRLRLENPNLRRVFDSMDVCQSVLGSFFVRTALGEFDFQDPRQLVAILVKMARNKVASVARHEHRQKRDNRRLESKGHVAEVAISQQTSPEQALLQDELLQRVKSLLSGEELEMVVLRQDGLGWDAVADQMGGTAQGRRMQLSRALDRVRNQLGFDENII